VEENEIGKIVVDACVSIHRELGSGLLESELFSRRNSNFEG
jgi:hypothetical protein